MTNDTETQEIPRKSVVGGSVNPKELETIEAARVRAGFKTMSEFVRQTMLRRARLLLREKRAEDRAA